MLAEIKNHDVIIINSAYATFFFTVSLSPYYSHSLSLSLSLCVWVHYIINIIIKYNCMLQLHSALKAVCQCGVSVRFRMPSPPPSAIQGAFLGAWQRHRHWQRATKKPRLLCKHSLKCLPRYAYAELAKARTKAEAGRGSGRGCGRGCGLIDGICKMYRTFFVFLSVITKFWNQFEPRETR